MLNVFLLAGNLAIREDIELHSDNVKYFIWSQLQFKKNYKMCPKFYNRCEACGFFDYFYTTGQNAIIQANIRLG